MIWYQIIYFFVAIAFAALNARWIEKGRKILHGWNGLLHIAVAVGASLLFEWYCFIAILCMTRVVFDVSLNLFRGLPVDYVPSKPKSIVDKLEKKIFGNDFFTPKIIYILIEIIINAIYF